MLRRSVVMVMAAGALALLALPASAKGIQQAMFTGPGLPVGGITITGDHPQLMALGALTDPSDQSVKPFSGPTGPAYRVVVTFDFAPGQPVLQTLYPYAAGGPRTYTPVNQPLAGGFAGYGWYQATPDLLPFLVRMGFPAHSPVAVDAPGTSETPGTVPGWGWMLIAFGMIGALTLVALRQRRRVVV